MKKEYQVPELSVVMLDMVDICTASGDTDHEDHFEFT